MYLFIYFGLGLCWCIRAFSSCSKLVATPYCCLRASHCSGFSSCQARSLECAGSGVVVHRLSCPVACGTFPHQGSDPCPLHWQAHSLPLDHQGSPTLSVLRKNPTMGAIILPTFRQYQFSRSVVSDSLQPHGLQHARLSCPSPTPRAYSNSCPLSW